MSNKTLLTGVCLFLAAIGRVQAADNSTYEPKDHVALQIDHRSTMAESVLGVDHPEMK